VFDYNFTLFIVTYTYTMGMPQLKYYQPRTNIVRDEKGDFVTDSHSILARWRNHLSQLLIVHEVNDVSHTEIHTTEPLVPEPSALG
jgi:hypothetical protein